MRNLSGFCVAVGVVLPLVAFWALFTHDSFSFEGGQFHHVDRTPELVSVFVAPVVSALLFVAAGRLQQRG